MRYSITCAALAAVLPVTAASATAYTDEAAWRAAVFNVYGFENFDALAAGSDVNTLAALNLRFLPLNDGTQPTVQRYAQTGGVVKSGPHNLLNDRDFALPGRGPINVTPLIPGEFLFGLGMWNVGGDDQLRLTFYDGANQIIEQVTSAPAFGFFGLVNNAGAVRAEIDFIGGNGYAPTDDWQAAARVTINPGVPEPSTWAMLILGFAVLGSGLRAKVRGTARLRTA